MNKNSKSTYYLNNNDIEFIVKSQDNIEYSNDSNNYKNKENPIK